MNKISSSKKTIKIIYTLQGNNYTQVTLKKRFCYSSESSESCVGWPKTFSVNDRINELNLVDVLLPIRHWYEISVVFKT